MYHFSLEEQLTPPSTKIPFAILLCIPLSLIFPKPQSYILLEIWTWPLIPLVFLLIFFLYLGCIQVSMYVIDVLFKSPHIFFYR